MSSKFFKEALNGISIETEQKVSNFLDRISNSNGYQVKIKATGTIGRTFHAYYEKGKKIAVFTYDENGNLNKSPLYRNDEQLEIIAHID
jgi:hypothetical protein